MAVPSAGRLSGALTGGIGFFAGWTAGSVPLTLAGADVSFLWIAWVTAALGAIAGASAGRALDNAPSLPLAPLQLPSARESLLWAGAAVVFLMAAAYFVKTSQALPLWCAALALSAAALWASRRAPMETAAGSNADPPIWAIGLLGLAIVLLYVFLHRPDADDAFYLNLPLGILDGRGGMMVYDTMYGDADWPLLGSNYRVEALPTLVAAIVRVTGFSVVTVAHGILPVLWCAAWTLTLVLLGLRFAGRRWWVFACFSVLATLAFGGTLQTWGVHGLARMFHGKGPLLLIVVPLIVHVVLLNRKNLLATSTAWLLLALLEIAALGLTANAIYIAPLTLGLAVAAAYIVQPDVRRSLLLLTPAVFPLSAGLWLMFIDPPVVAGQGTPSHDLSIWDMAGSKLTLALLLSTILGAAMAARLAPRARIVTAFVLAALLLIVNPVLWPFFDRHVTGGLGFRIWWALPLPMLLALELTWLTAIIPRPRLAVAAAGICLAGMAFLPSGLIGMEDTSVSPSLHKLPPEADMARRVTEIAQDGRTLAPEAVAAWLPIQDHRVPLVFARRLYLDHSAQIVHEGSNASRILLSDWIDGRVSPSDTALSDALSELCVRTLVLNKAQNLDRPSPISGETVADFDGYVVLSLHPECR